VTPTDAIGRELRGMCAAILALEAIVLGLTTPVMIGVEKVPVGTALAVGLSLAVVCFVTAGLLRHRFAYLVGHLVQIVAIGLGFVVPIMFFIGAMFAALWAGAYLLGRRIQSDKAKWAADNG
jgi:hypothetical protein